MGEREGGQAEMDGTGQGDVLSGSPDAATGETAPGLSFMQGGEVGAAAWRAFTRIARDLDPIESNPNFYRDGNGTTGVLLDDDSFHALDEFLRG